MKINKLNHKKYNIMKKRIIIITTITLILTLAITFFIRYYFVFGDGVKAGELNYFVHKGYIFKTYEGKVIQAGFRGRPNVGTQNNIIQSYEFEFSVENKQVADSLMRCSGKTVELHYKEYLAPIFWRGMSKYVVDDIVSVR